MYIATEMPAVLRERAVRVACGTNEIVVGFYPVNADTSKTTISGHALWSADVPRLLSSNPDILMAAIRDRLRWVAGSTGGCNTLRAVTAAGVLQMHQRKRIYYSETQKSLMWDRWDGQADPR